MTLYNIKACLSDGGDINANITARSENEAKKYFRESCKADGIKILEITGIEVAAVNVPASKQQERETLEAIRKMVAELGENSYIGTAFEGCFEIAEQNIENDFGGSMKQRADGAEQAELESNAAIKELEAKLKTATAEIEALKKAIEEERKEKLSTADLNDLATIVRGKQKDYKKTHDESAIKIIKFAENPNSDEFKTAVKEHRSSAEAAKSIEHLVTNINAILYK